jgi:tetratricopeptide (TPR) repeat protein
VPTTSRLHQLASDYAIMACTNLIEGGKLDKREQAIAYVQRALADLNRAIELDSGLAPIYANRGQLVKAYANRGASYLRKGDVDGALADFDRAIELQPQAPEALAGRAQANLKKGLAAKALPDVEQALSLDPNDPFAHDTRAHVLAALGRRKEAIAEYRKALAIEPDLQESVQGLNALTRGSASTAPDKR